MLYKNSSSVFNIQSNSRWHWKTMRGHLDSDLVPDTPFPSFHDESSLGMQCICVLLKHNQRLLIPHQVPRGVPHQRALFLRDQSGGPSRTHTSRHLGIMWPLTLDLSVCKLIRQGRCSVCSVALCFEEETPGWSGEGLSPQSAHTAEHT